MPFDTAATLTCRSRRRLAATGAFATTAAIGLSLLAAFDSRSSDAWLPPSAVLSQQLAACDGTAARGARDRCKQDVVAAGRAQRQGTSRVALSGP